MRSAIFAVSGASWRGTFSSIRRAARFLGWLGNSFTQEGNIWANRRIFGQVTINGQSPPPSPRSIGINELGKNRHKIFAIKYLTTKSLKQRS